MFSRIRLDRKASILRRTTMKMKSEWVASMVMARINLAEGQLVELNFNLDNSPENMAFKEKLVKVMDDIAALRGYVR